MSGTPSAEPSSSIDAFLERLIFAAEINAGMHFDDNPNSRLVVAELPSFVGGGAESATENAVRVAQRFDDDQAALIAIAKFAKRIGGVSEADADVLRAWADEFGVSFRGPEIHPDRPIGQFPHIHVGPVGHIPFNP